MLSALNCLVEDESVFTVVKVRSKPGILRRRSLLESDSREEKVGCSRGGSSRATGRKPQELGASEK